MKPHSFEIVDWQDNAVVLLDQRLLPNEEKYLRLTTLEQVAEAIKNLTVRGAPAIGVTAAMGVALGVLKGENIESVCQTLFKTRPTAVNLSWALDKMKDVAKKNDTQNPDEFKKTLIAAAIKIKNDDIQTNKEIGKHGQKVLQDGDTILTHCNAGALATAGYGTALGVIYAAIESGKKVKVICDETRPVLQGSRLSAWELKKNGVPVTVITDNMAASLMKAGDIQKVIVGADRIAANGDTANKIGTYSVAINAKYHGIPFYVAAPFSTIDVKTKSGRDIVIEERAENEVVLFNGKRTAPEGVAVRNPAFDVTPHDLITAIITEKSVFTSPFEEKLLVHDVK